MLESYDAIINYLLKQNLIRKDRIIQNDLKLLEVSRRNYNFQVISEKGPSYFLKRDKFNSKGEIKFATVAYEAKVYNLLEKTDKENQFFNYLPRCYNFDSKENLLILELINGAVNLADYQFNKIRFSNRIAGELGKALALLHENFNLNNEEVSKFENIYSDLPAVFFLTQPDQSAFLNSSSANIEYIKIFQKFEDLTKEFNELRFQWKTETLIHGDIKWRNCLVVSQESLRTKFKIKIIDWELAFMGDACWDVGTIFSEYLNCWISSFPMVEDKSVDKFLETTRFPLQKMHSSIRFFWNTYVKYKKIDPDEQQEFLLRAIKYAGVRLIQTSFEKLQFETNITGEAIYAMQLCLNILSRPAEAAVQLLGLPLHSKFHGSK